MAQMLTKSWPGQLLVNLGLTILAVSRSEVTFFNNPGSFTERSNLFQLFLQLRALGAFGHLKKVASFRAQGALGAVGPLKEVASLRDPCPESPKMVGYTFCFMPRTSQNGPTILGFSMHEIKGVADHFGGFRAWIPERSDFFEGPKGPKGPLGPACICGGH